MDIVASGHSRALLDSYAGLFKACFPGARHLDAHYLRWLYADNPAGAVVGFDAWESGRLAAHYACIPVDASVSGRSVKVVLSLNTATHPDFQGKGLFVRLAEATYAAAAAGGFAAAYGVANAQSTPGFLRKLGFALVAPLDARIGFGALPQASPDAVAGQADFQRTWSRESLDWRIGNPARPYSLVRAPDGWVGAYAPTGRLGIQAWAQVPQAAAETPVGRGARALPRLHLGLVPDAARAAHGAWFDVPQRFRTSPLNFIYRPFDGGAQPRPGHVAFGQLDFDAF